MTVCDLDNCAGCMLCLDVCKKNAIKIEDTLYAYNAVIDEARCINCNACKINCPQNRPTKKVETKIWYQGWSRDSKIRHKAPSGGIGMALAKQFIAEGGYVCSCVFKDGMFGFDVTNNIECAMCFTGSKYVKSNPKDIYCKIRKLLVNKEKVLFIGLPCQVAAVKKRFGNLYEENLFLVDLVCHGTPSPRLLEIFLKQYSKKISEIKDIKFRIKGKYQIIVDDKNILKEGVSDRYSIAFINGITFTNNCYSCQYAATERVGDISLGDAYGSELSDEEIQKGISLIMIQSSKGRRLLLDSDIELKNFDKNVATSNNTQLISPMEKTKTHDIFFNEIKKQGHNRFNKLVFKNCMKDCLKQDVKYLLIKCGLF